MYWRRNAADSQLRLLEQAVQKDPDNFRLRLELMRRQLRYGHPIFQYSITYKIMQPDSDGEIETSEDGFEIEDVKVTFEELMRRAKHRYVQARYPRDLTSWWEIPCEDDPYTGEHQCWDFHVEYADGQRLHDEMFNIINAAIQNNYKVPEEFRDEND